MTERRIFHYENEIGNFRKVRIWEKVGENTVREIDAELAYHYPKERWETSYQYIRTYEITNDGILVGDGSNWSGEGRHWKRHAELRFEKSLQLRFPKEYGNQEPTPDVKEVAAEQIAANY